MIAVPSKNHLIYFTVIILLINFSSCKRSTNHKLRPKDYKEPLIKVNKYLVDKDQEAIESYIERHKWSMLQSSTGLWYEIITSDSSFNQPVQPGDFVTLNYKVKLLNGKLCYDSDSLGPKSFKVGKGGVESGLEEGILLMHEGDKAKFIMPPYLAFGILGDGKKIPGRATIIYEVELIALNY